MPTYKTEGIIIKRTNFGEADKILTVLTRNRGKLKVLAKGIRRINSRRAGNVELFNQAVIFLAEGRTFKILTEARTVRSFPQLRTELTMSAAAFYLAELVDRLIPEEQDHPAVFELLSKALGRLNGEKYNPAGLIEDFEKDILVLTGFARYPSLVTSKPHLVIEKVLGRHLRSRRFLEKVREKGQASDG